MFTQSLIDVDLLREWVREAGRIALSQLSARRIDIKPDLTPVTDVDRQVETFLLEKITRHYVRLTLMDGGTLSLNETDFAL